MNLSANIIIGKCLRQQREVCGLTQENIARALDRPQSFVSKIETGERGLQVSELFDYANALKETPEEILGKIEYALTKI